MTAGKLTGRRVSEEVVRSIEQPDFTKSWHPYSHRIVLDVLEAAVEQEDLIVGEKKYSLSGNGSNMFGVWNILNIKTEEVRLVIGFRNSVSKQLSWAIGGGLDVFVCENLIFRAKFTEFRRHTASFSDEAMIVMARRIIRRVVQRDFTELVNWQNDLKQYPLTEAQSSVLMMRALKEDTVPTQKLYQLIHLYEKSERYTQTLHGFHGAFTEIAKEDSFFTNEWRNQRIAKLIDKAILEFYDTN